MGDNGRRYIIEGVFTVSLVGAPAYLLFCDHGFGIWESIGIMACQMSVSLAIWWLLSKTEKK